MGDIPLREMMGFVARTGNRTEHHLRNSLEMELLMELEEQGLGHWTISQLLNCLQDMYANGETQSFYVLENRRKRVSCPERDELAAAIQRCYDRARDHYNKKLVSGGRVKVSAVAACTWIAGELHAVMEQSGIEHFPLD